MEPLVIGAGAGVAAAAGLSAAVARLGLVGLFRREPGRLPLDWERLTPTPLGEKKYTPQGLAWVQGRLVFANTWKNTRSRVYEYRPDNMEVLRTFDMPPEAVHTSGITWDGERLWAVDYKSNRCYCLDCEASFNSGHAAVLGSFDTTLRGTSACCLAPYGEGQRLIISDFMRTKRGYFVDHLRAMEQGTARGAIDFSYRNGGFSQGLEWAGGWLWESENRYGTDVLNQLDLDLLLATGHFRQALVQQFDGPHQGVEDLAWDGEHLWTSDEVDFHFYRVKLDVTAP